MIKKAFERVGAYYFIFETYSQAKKVIWEGRGKEQSAGKMGMTFLEYIPEELRKFNNNELKITLVNGSIIRLIGSEQCDSIRGTNPIGVVFSEYAYQNPMVWDVIEPILMENNGWAAFESTPRGQNHFYKMEMSNLTNKNWYISEIQTLWKDLPNYYEIITEAQIGQLRKEGKTEEYIEQEYGVSYTSGAKGNYYSDQIIAARESKRIGNFPYDDKLWVDIFTDLGWSDDTVLLFKQQDGKANIFIDIYEDNTKTIPHYVQVIRDKGYRIRNIYMPHDGKQGKFQMGFSHSQMFEGLLRQAGIRCDIIQVERPAAIQDVIDAVRGRFSTYFFNETNMAEALVKLSLYHRQYDKINQCFKEQPVHDWTSHVASAFGIEAISAPFQSDGITTGAPVIRQDFDPLDYEDGADGHRTR